MPKTDYIYSYCVKCKGTGKLEVIVRYEGNPPVPVYETQVCDDCKGVKKFKVGEIIKED